MRRTSTSFLATNQVRYLTHTHSPRFGWCYFVGALDENRACVFSEHLYYMKDAMEWLLGLDDSGFGGFLRIFDCILNNP